MAEIKPFAALRYNPRQFGKDLSAVVAPPYDVLDANDKAALLRRSDRNIVAVDLPHVPPKTAGPDELYAAAATRLQDWVSDGTLAVEPDPALYVYHQIYSHAGRQFTRKMFLASMRLEPFGQGHVFPHEQTFGGPKEDRLKLMQATQCQLSPVFGLYNDPGNVVSGMLDSKREPEVTAELEGVVHRVWVLQDAAIIATVTELMQDRAVFIADGHHRYGTALNYREYLTARTGPLTLDHPANYVLIGLCAMEDPGCVILPTHRILSGFADPQQALAALEKGVRLQPAGPADPAFSDGGLGATSAADVAVYVAAGDRRYLGTFTDRKVLEKLAPDRSPAWRKLDLAYLHRYLIDELVTKEVLGGNPPTIHYIKSAADAIKDARETNGICILTRPGTMVELRAVCEAADLMPQKSTYFYPKLATGLVIHRLEP